MSFLDRKDSHIQVCLDEDIDFYSDNNPISKLSFEHDALPEINLEDVDITTSLFEKKLKAPLYIGSMTGGAKQAEEINLRLAQAAAFCGVGMALGSQRKMLEDESWIKSYDMKSRVPQLPLLFGNIGAVQLNYGVGLQEIKGLIDSTQVDGFFFHLNPLQEAIQPEGQTRFKDLLVKMAEIIPELSVPVFVKEVGAGISRTTAKKLSKLPLCGIETAGVGGTSWAKIEGIRSEKDLVKQNLGDSFSQWGESTLNSLINIKIECPKFMAFASGGIRNGVEAAKALALGADAVSMALPFLKAAQESTEAVIKVIENFKAELRLVLFLTGSKNISELKTKRLV